MKTRTERFWAKVEKRGPAECWLWLASRNAQGYGKFSVASGRGHMGAHRAVWELVNGAVPDGLWVLHRCDNPPCVNPAHLFLGTCRDNHLDMVAKGRHWAQKNPGRARLTMQTAIDASIAKALNRMVPDCVRCGQPARIRRKGRCNTCSAYFTRKGVERPQYAIDGRRPSPEERPRRLDADCVAAIRAVYRCGGADASTLARWFGVSRSYAWAVATGRA